MNLSWHQTSEIQAEAIENLKVSLNDDDFRLLLQPNGKDTWENAAKILFDCAERLPNTLLPELLAWLQDLNWPGANIITNLMVKINSEPTQLQLEKVIQQATIEKDEEWLENLITLQHRLKN